MTLGNLTECQDYDSILLHRHQPVDVESTDEPQVVALKYQRNSLVPQNSNAKWIGELVFNMSHALNAKQTK